MIIVIIMPYLKMVWARKSVFKSSYTSALQNPINTVILHSFYCSESVCKTTKLEIVLCAFSVKFTDPQPYSTM